MSAPVYLFTIDRLSLGSAQRALSLLARAPTAKRNEYFHHGALDALAACEARIHALDSDERAAQLFDEETRLTMFATFLRLPDRRALTGLYHGLAIARGRAPRHRAEVLDRLCVAALTELRRDPVSSLADLARGHAIMLPRHEKAAATA